MTAVLSAHGIRAHLPSGWEGRISKLSPSAAPALLQPQSVHALAQEVISPFAHFANMALPAEMDSFGGGAVERLGPENILVCLIEYSPECAGTALFARRDSPGSCRPVSSIGGRSRGSCRARQDCSASSRSLVDPSASTWSWAPSSDSDQQFAKPTDPPRHRDLPRWGALMTGAEPSDQPSSERSGAALGHSRFSRRGFFGRVAVVGAALSPRPRRLRDQAGIGLGRRSAEQMTTALTASASSAAPSTTAGTSAPKGRSSVDGGRRTTPASAVGGPATTSTATWTAEPSRPADARARQPPATTASSRATSSATGSATWRSTATARCSAVS